MKYFLSCKGIKIDEVKGTATDWLNGLQVEVCDEEIVKLV
jgi:hypothetical protein